MECATTGRVSWGQMRIFETATARRTRRRRRTARIAVALMLLLGCARRRRRDRRRRRGRLLGRPTPITKSVPRATEHGRSSRRASERARGRHPPVLNIYSHTPAGMLTSVTRRARYLVYVPDSQGNGVYVINPRTYRVILHYQTGAVGQHVVHAWDLRTLYATNDIRNSLTPIDPTTGRRAAGNIPVADRYNMYFTPDGRHAIVVEEGQGVLAFRDAHTFALQKTFAGALRRR